MSQRFCFALLSGERYLRKHMLPWIWEAGGLIGYEELEHRVALKARETLDVCCPKSVIYPNHLALEESRDPGYFGGGYFFNLEIASPRREEVVDMLLRTIRKQKNAEFSSVIRYFREHYDLLPTIILIDPLYGQRVNPKGHEGAGERIERLRVCLTLSHRITRWVTYTCDMAPQPHSKLLHAESSLQSV